MVAVPRSEEVRFTDMCSARGFPHLRIGVTDGAGADAVLDVQGQFAVPLAELRAAWAATLPGRPRPEAQRAPDWSSRRQRGHGDHAGAAQPVGALVAPHRGGVPRVEHPGDPEPGGVGGVQRPLHPADGGRGGAALEPGRVALGQQRHPGRRPVVGVPDDRPRPTR